MFGLGIENETAEVNGTAGGVNGVQLTTSSRGGNHPLFMSILLKVVTKLTKLTRVK